jgi:triosephosphate isomerase
MNLFVLNNLNQIYDVLNQEINNRVQQAQQTQQGSFTAPVSTDGVTDITV